MCRSTKFIPGAYSPRIEMTLYIDGRQLPVAEVGPDYLVVQSPHSIGPIAGILIITVDGSDARWHVWLPMGINTNQDRQPLVVLDTSAPGNPAAAG